MAEYSKEYCEKHMQGWPPDFSILEEAKSIPKGHYKPQICEGYGFIGMEVSVLGVINLLFRADDIEAAGIVRVPFQDLETVHNAKGLPWQRKNFKPIYHPKEN